MPDGLLLVDKPRGISSHRAVAIARRLLGLRKIGHAGTLDPMATGLLILGVGPSTRLLTHLVGLSKRYEATVRLGVSTDSDDADGTIVDARGVPPEGIDTAELEAAMASLRGPIMQVPSSVSAISIDGRRAYERARSGESVVIPARPVTVYRFVRTGMRTSVLDSLEAPVTVTDVDVVVECSSGTYVRALARDVGHALGVGAHLVALRRTDVGPFSIAEAVDLEADGLDARSALLSPSDAVRRLFPVVRLAPPEARDLADGKRVPVAAADDPGPVAAIDAATDRLVGLVSVSAGRLRVITNFPAATQIGGGA